MPPELTHISGEEWDDHKATIKRLYLKEKRNLTYRSGVKEGVIAYMSRHHRFNASVSQYQARLKHWDFRRNLTEDDWTIIARIVEQRNNRGQSTAVYVSGELLKNKQVRKGITRPAVRRAIENCRDEPQNHTLPRYLEIRSPDIRAPQDEEMLDITPISLGNPIDSIQSSFPSSLRQEMHSVQAASEFDLDLAQVGTNNDQTTENSFMSLDPLFSISSNSLLAEYGGIILEPNSVLTQLMDNLPELNTFSPYNTFGESNSGLRDVIRKKLQDLLPSDILSAPTFLEWMLTRDWQRYTVNTLIETAYIASLSAIIPKQHSPNLAAVTQGAAIFRIAISELVNNKPKSVNPLDPRGYNNEPSAPVQWAMSYLQQQSLKQFEKFRDCLPLPFSISLYRSLFVGASKLRAFEVVRGLVHSCPTSLDEMIGLNTWLLDDVFFMGPPSLVELIVGIDSLLCRPSFANLFHGFDPKNVEVLLRANFTIKWAKVLEASITSSGDFARTTKPLIELIPGAKHEQLILSKRKRFNNTRGGVLSRAVRLLNKEDALWTVTTLLKDVQPYVADSGYDNDLPIHMTHALRVAIAREYDSVIGYLIDVVKTPIDAECLDEAVCVRRFDLIQMLMKQGVSPLSLVDRDDHISLDRHNKTTPFATALLMGYHEAVEFFMDQLDMEMNDNTLFTLVKAASTIGSNSLVERLLKLSKIPEAQPINLEDQCWWRVPEIEYPFRQLTDAVSVARKNGHRRVLYSLFRAGAGPPLELFEDAIRSERYSVKARDSVIARLFEQIIDWHEFGDDPDHLRAAVIQAAIDRGDVCILLSVLECVNVGRLTHPKEILNYAIGQGNPVMVQKLIELGFDPNSPDEGKTKSRTTQNSLTVALQNGNKEIIDLISSQNVSLNFRRRERVYPCRPPHPEWVSPLRAAIALQNDQMIHQCLAQGSNPYDVGVVSDLAKIEDWTKLKMILEEGRKRTRGTRQMCFQDELRKALASNNIHLIRCLSGHTVLDVLSATGVHFVRKSVLGYAIEAVGQNPRSVKAFCILLESGCNIQAVCYKEVDLSESYDEPWERRDDPDRESFSSARLYRYSSIIHVRLPYYHMDDVRGSISFDPLLSAVFWNSIPCIDKLLKHGISINRPATNTIPRTALQLAAELGYYEMVKYLVDLHADVNGSPAHLNGLTALQASAKGGYYGIAEYLIEKGANPDALPCRVHGITALEGATKYGRLDIMLLLVRNGAGFAVTNKGNQFDRAIELAEARGETPAVQLAKELKSKFETARFEVLTIEF